jgi:hypothetical protein
VPRIVDNFVQCANGFVRQFWVFNSDYNIFCIYEPTLHNLVLSLCICPCRRDPWIQPLPLTYPPNSLLDSRGHSNPHNVVLVQRRYLFHNVNSPPGARKDLLSARKDSLSARKCTLISYACKLMDVYAMHATHHVKFPVPIFSPFFTAPPKPRQKMFM